MLEDATELDPKFTDAWARLAGACVFMAGTFDPTQQWYRKGEHAMRRALALNPTDSEALCARGRILWTPLKGYKNRQALINLSASLKRNPGYHPALVWRSLILLHCGVHEEAIEGLKEALASHPDDGFALTFLGQVYLFEGDHSEAEKYFQRALSLDPTSLWANLFSPMVPLYGSNPESGVGILRAAEQVVPGDALLMSWEGLLWAKRGEPRKAKQLIQKALKVGKSVLHTHHMWHTAAATYATIGMPAEAVRLLTKAGSTGLPNYKLFHEDPHFRTLQNYPPFLRFLAKMKKESESYRREFGNPALIH
jgi:tetratricopeptide (TPR) repeat protein